MKWYALLFSLMLAACSKGGNDNNANPIPTDLPFNEKTLPAISDAELAQAKILAKIGGDATNPNTHVLIDSNESSSDRSRRLAALAKLRPEVQQIIRDLNTKCALNPKKDQDSKDGLPTPGRVYKSSESNRTSGANCPVDMFKDNASNVRVLRFVQQPLSFAMDFTGTGSARAAYRDPEHQRILETSSFDFKFTFRGNSENNNDMTNGYTRMDGGGTLQSPTQGTIGLTAVMESLERPEVDKSLMTVRITQNGRTFVFTQFHSAANKAMPVPRFFIGNRELSRDEVLAMGEFPFSVNDNDHGLGKPGFTGF